MKFNFKYIADNGLLIACYIALTFLTYPFSYGPIQFRVAEALIFLCFFRKDFIIGLTLGTLISNVGSFNPIDMIIGTVATFLSCLVIIFSKHLFIGIIVPTLFNGFIIGAELYFVLNEPFWLSVLTVSLGEIVVLIFGYVLFMFLKKNKSFFTFIRATQNIDFKF
jgi:uncharacterized membrane protein